MRDCAFVFTGSGAAGAVQAGMVKRALETGIPVPNISLGVSSGGLNAFGLRWLGPNGLADFWSNIDSLFDVFHLNLMPWKSSGVFNAKPLRKKIVQITAKPPEYVGMATKLFHLDLGDGSYQMFTANRIMIDEIIYSISIPGMVETPTGLGDAGSRVLNPIEHAFNLGAKKVYVFGGRPEKLPKWTPGKWPALTSAYRALDINIHEIAMRDLRKSREKYGSSLEVFLPDEQFVEGLEFKKSRDAVEYGYKQGVRIFG